MQFTASFVVLAIAQGIAAISLHPRQYGCEPAACAASVTEETGPMHCCPPVPDLPQPACQSIYHSCAGATCSPGTEWTITCEHALKTFNIEMFKVNLLAAATFVATLAGSVIAQGQNVLLPDTFGGMSAPRTTTAAPDLGLFPS
ncbi:hypothetical protein ONZ45_g10833 [Pleurotus djamor]|nr:hypothetical protein ONZ45_g10833 [Pleurotus djamor]